MCMGRKIYDEDDIQRLGHVIAEDIISKFQTAMKAITEIKAQVRKIPAMQTDIKTLKTDMKVVKLAITHTNKDHQILKKRVTRLENTVYHGA
jgi:hypothetical protein